METLATALQTHGYWVKPRFLPTLTARGLATEIQDACRAKELRPASVGHGAHVLQNQEIRGDLTQWWEPNKLSSLQREVWIHLEAIRQTLNHELFLGLWDFETHSAWYPPGSFYQKHVDAFKDDDRRTISAVLYLNRGWNPSDGGQLRLYPKSETPVDVVPEEGTLACFLSRELPHEVLPTQRDRLSVTTWFRVRSQQTI